MSTPTTPEGWLFELKHYKSFINPISDPSDPYLKAISTFQLFTNAIIRGITRKDPSILNLIDDSSLTAIYIGLPWFTPEFLKLWVKDAMLKHPLRRTAKQHHFLVIMRMQGRSEFPSAGDISVAAAVELDDWKTRVYDPENLDKDPDALYFLRNKNGIKNIDPSQENADHPRECLICDNSFDEDAHVTQRAPCGHVVCKECFDKWLEQCKGTLTCMLCRACVVCGLNNCPHHEVHQDQAPPQRLSKILDLVLPNKMYEVLHGIKPERYWALREITRQDRATLAWIDERLRVSDLGPGEPIWLRYTQDALDILMRVAGVVDQAMVEA